MGHDLEVSLNRTGGFDRRKVMGVLGAALVAPTNKRATASFGAGCSGRVQKFDWRAEGASPQASGAHNRRCLEQAARKAAAVQGYVSLGAGDGPYLLERWQPTVPDLVVDGNGVTLQQAVPENVAARAIGGSYGSFAAVLVGPAGRGFRLENVRLTQNPTQFAALPLVNASRTFLGPVVVRRADGVRLIDIEFDSTTGPAFLWRGGNDGEVRAVVHHGRATVHNGFRADPFAGDAGYADEAEIFSPRRFRGDLRFVGSPVDAQAAVQLHLTGANDWDVAVRFDGVTRTDVTLMRAYSNDYGLYLGDNLSRDTTLRGEIRSFSARGVWKAPLEITTQSTERRLDRTRYAPAIVIRNWDVVAADGTIWAPPSGVTPA